MDYRRFGDTYMVRIDRGEEVIEKFTEFVTKEGITLAGIHGIGAADRATFGVLNTETKEFYNKDMEGHLEISSLIGNVSELDGKPYIHFHITLSDVEGKCYGGHLKSCRIGGTCELTVNVLDGHVGRKKDERIGIYVYDFK